MNIFKKSLGRKLILLVIISLTIFPFNKIYGATIAPATRDATAVLQRIQSRVTPAQRQAAADRRATSVVSSKSSGPAKVKSLAAPLALAAPLVAPLPGGTPDYFNYPNWTNSPIIRKFVDSLPGLGSANVNNLGQYIPVAVADSITYPGSDYYEIAVIQYKEKMNTDLATTTLRGYIQLETPVNASISKHIALSYPNGKPILDFKGKQVYAIDKPHYLGPTIIAQKNVPTRVKFTNYLPTGVDGNLFIPVDTTVMGAGMGPLDMPGMPGMKESYTQNRATLHLHGGATPWISDGTPHQWVTPAGENTQYPQGVSVTNVPDMPAPEAGSMTFFYTNQQSARLMFYHDHSYGITRLNVYAGEAAGYLLTDPAEQNLISTGAIPADEIPLIIQDKTFVDAATIPATDPTWNWGSTPGTAKTGDLWFPHVYMPNQNPNDPLGVNAFGRWDYGPWFWPPVTTSSGLIHPSVTNTTTGIVSPGVPDVSMTMEAFMDTPVVNGTAYPFVDVQPKAYRLRVLNASNDRFWNLQLYIADPSIVTADGRTNTEVKMIPASAGPNIPAYWPTMDNRVGGVPDPATAGPDMIQIGTEGGFLPAPAVLKNTPIGYDRDTRSITVGNVKEHTLLLGPAERADVIVDFSPYAGKTILLYSDAPAPVPGLDPRLDYYTGDPDLTSTGGAKTTTAGYGPNTRTLMQFRVAAGTSTPFSTTLLDTALPAAFASSLDPIIVPQTAYNAVYGTSTLANKYAKIGDTALTFTPLGATSTLTIPMQSKAIQELFELDYGRMNSTLGVELPLTNFNTQTTIPLGYIDPVTEDITDSMTPLTPVSGDGTQIWKITHNGVDTHAMHFHLFNVQLINRVDWAGVIKAPDANELGWKDTVRMNPLEDAIVALRPVAPKTNFGIADSIRYLDPTMPQGSTLGFSKVDANNLPVATTNQIFNFGWEYVWHCHLLGHEEMDMMRPIKFNVARTLPAVPTLIASSTSNQIKLSWTDGTPVSNPTTLGNPANEVGYRIERAVVASGTPLVYKEIALPLANATSYLDTALTSGTNYSYQVAAYNAAGAVTSTPQTAMATVTNLSATVSLKPGWNLITLPIQPVDASNLPINYTAETFGKLIGADVVTNWANISQTYNNHIIGLPLNNFNLTNSLGFFAHIATSSTVNLTGTAFSSVVPTVVTGWNLLGWNNPVTTNANSLGLSVAGDVVSRFDSTLQQWVNHIVGLPLNNFNVIQGDGVFVHKP